MRESAKRWIWALTQVTCEFTRSSFLHSSKPKIDLYVHFSSPSQLNHLPEKECPWNVVHSDSILLKQVMMAFEEIPTRCWDLSMKICSLWAINLPTIISSTALHCHVIVWLAVQRRCAIPFCNSNVIDCGASAPSLIAKLFASGRLILCDLTCDTWLAN